jgi:hypothetical protein
VVAWAAHSSREQIVVQYLSSDALAVMLATDLSPSISAFVVDPGYSGYDDQSIRCITDGTPSLIFAAISIGAPLDAVP